MEAAKALVIGLVGAIQSAAAVMRPGDSSEARPAAQEGPQAATARAQTGGDTARARGHAHSGNCFRTPRAPEATHRCCKKPGPGDRSVAACAASAAADPEVIPLPGQRGGSEACEGLRRRRRDWTGPAAGADSAAADPEVKHCYSLPRRAAVTT
ncbi:hypothetical protein NDU88_000071 [Pleurodeles waltl]|uniref:Secreted protein n=1 Tax=Pleurodeles waltl TaxID=8319 RepID=A0AAV7SW45_PLEWA|nr:hypothetical protein NDU88_000071 [Pleurodeles waltl]